MLKFLQQPQVENLVHKRSTYRVHRAHLGLCLAALMSASAIYAAAEAEFYTTGMLGRSKNRGVTPVDIKRNYSETYGAWGSAGYNPNHWGSELAWRFGLGYRQSVFSNIIGLVDIGVAGYGVRKLTNKNDFSFAEYHLSGADAGVGLGYLWHDHTPSIWVGVGRVRNQLAQTQYRVATKVWYGSYYDTRAKIGLGYTYTLANRTRFRIDASYIPGHKVTSAMHTDLVPNVQYKIVPNEFPEVMTLVMGLEFGRR